MKAILLVRTMVAMLVVLTSSLANAGSPRPQRSPVDYPMSGWVFGLEEDGQVREGAITPRYAGGKLATLEERHYSGSSYAALEAEFKARVGAMRRDFGGTTFGTDAATGKPVDLDDTMQAVLLGMLQRSPQAAENTRSKGGVLTATFEIRPVLQPRNANLYLHAIYDAKSRQYFLKSILDAPATRPREDITGMVVDMPGEPSS